MSQQNGLNRRAFLRNAGLTALAGAAASTQSPLLAATDDSAAVQATNNGPFDFDTVYNRFGTDSTKFDQQIRVYGKDSVLVGMGIADIDFKAAPSITKAINDRVKHENWGYLDMGKWTPKVIDAVVAWNKSHYNVTVDPICPSCPVAASVVDPTGDILDAAEQLVRAMARATPSERKAATARMDQLALPAAGAEPAPRHGSSGREPSHGAI